MEDKGSNDRIPNETEVKEMVRDILTRQMDEDPEGSVISSGIILPTISEHGFAEDHEAMVENPAEDIWGRYLKGEIDDPLAAVEDITPPFV